EQTLKLFNLEYIQHFFQDYRNGGISMRQPPINRIATDAIKACKITAPLYVAVLWLLTIAGAVLSFVFVLSLVYFILAFIIFLLSTYLFVFLIPKLRRRSWRYELFEQEIYIQHNILIMLRTFVPKIRVQHLYTQHAHI